MEKETLNKLREKEKKTVLSLSLDISIKEKLVEYCKEQGIHVSNFVNELLKEELKKPND